MTIQINSYNLAVLLYNCVNSTDKDLDANMLHSDLERELNHKFHITTDLLEKALCLCNFNEEEKKFFHPQGLTFDQFCARILKEKGAFDKKRNLVNKKEN